MGQPRTGCAMTKYCVDSVVVMMVMMINGKDGRSGGIHIWLLLIMYKYRFHTDHQGF
jgi:hypothetical protein